MMPHAVACALLRVNFAGSFARSSALIRQKRANAALSRSKLLSTSGLALSQDVTVSVGSPTLLSTANSWHASGDAGAECCTIHLYISYAARTFIQNVQTYSVSILGQASTQRLLHFNAH